MRCSVKILTASILALSIGFFSTGAHAGQACFRLNPFTDYLKLELGPVTNGHRNVYGNWIVPGEYTLPVSGALELNLGSTTVRRLGIVGTNNNPAVFNDNLICGLDGIGGRAFEVNCSGGPGANFQFSGTLAPISCAGLASSAARVAGRTGGSK